MPSITTCVFCGGEFEDPAPMNKWVECPEEEGGCGREFKIVLRSKPVVKDDG